MFKPLKRLRPLGQLSPAAVRPRTTLKHGRTDPLEKSPNLYSKRPKLQNFSSDYRRAETSLPEILKGLQTIDGYLSEMESIYLAMAIRTPPTPPNPIVEEFGKLLRDGKTEVEKYREFINSAYQRSKGDNLKLRGILRGLDTYSDITFFSLRFRETFWIPFLKKYKKEMKAKLLHLIDTQKDFIKKLGGIHVVEGTPRLRRQLNRIEKEMTEFSKMINRQPDLKADLVDYKPLPLEDFILQHLTTYTLLDTMMSSCQWEI